MSISISIRRGALALGVFGALVAPFSLTQPIQAAANAYVRVLHASPDAPAVEVFVDGAKAVRSLSFPKVTPFLSVPAGSHHLQVFPAGAAYSAMGGVINVTVPFKANIYYTVAAVGQLKSISAKVFSLPAGMNSAKATVRFIHLAPNAPAVDIEAKGAGLIFKDVSFPNRAMAPVTVPTGTYTLLVHPAGADTTTVLMVSGVQFKADHDYTVVAVGLLKGMGAEKLSAVVLDDDPMSSSM